MKALLSIKPEFVQKIFSGEKKYEYRKAIFKKNVDSIVIYATQPIGKIVGEFKIKSIITDKPNQIWYQTNQYSGVNKNFFENYFSSRGIGYAIEIENVIQYAEPVDPKTFDKKFYPPQSFQYLQDDFFEKSDNCQITFDLT